MPDPYTVNESVTQTPGRPLVLGHPWRAYQPVCRGQVKLLAAEGVEGRPYLPLNLP